MIRLQATHFATLMILAMALVAGRAGQRVVDLSGLSLEGLPQQLGPWECTSEETVVGKDTEESRCVRRDYDNGDGARIMAYLQVTSSRLGALRNWPIARMGTGWNVEELGVWRSDAIAGLPFEMQASQYWLHRVGVENRKFSLIWFVSPDGQSPNFEGAQTLGWRDRMLGNCMWGEMYLETIGAESEEQMQEATRDLAMRLAPAFHELIQAAGSGRALRSRDTTDGTT